MKCAKLAQNQTFIKISKKMCEISLKTQVSASKKRLKNYKKSGETRVISGIRTENKTVVLRFKMCEIRLKSRSLY